MRDDTALPETWREIPSYEGIYEVSDFGRVRSLDRFISYPHVSNGLGVRRRGQILKTPPGNHGYPFVRLTGSDHRPRGHLVHRLVLVAFVGPCPPGMEACHNNGSRLDARLPNLRWDTSSENSNDIVRHGRNRMALRQTCPLGHLLVEPNLRSHTAAAGHRGCLACSRAAAYVSRQRRRGLAVDKKALADTQYQRIMAGLPAYANGRGRRQAS